MNVLAAMSGGVDSSVAAALLKKDGHAVTGVTMLLRPGGDENDADPVRRVAEHLGIEHIVLDFSDRFREDIIEPFCREYTRGRTPNPCALCNRRIKFGALLDWALEHGYEKIATGHYTRLQKTSGVVTLLTGTDRNKDQSYFLSRLTLEQLSHTLFPVGDLNKQQVRKIAAELGLPVTERESREICFVPDNDYTAFVNRYLGRKPVPGPIYNSNGEVLGEHSGITGFTVGQRHGLGIAAPRPLYVTGIVPEKNAVIVGEEDATKGTDLTATGMNWLTPDIPDNPFPAQVKIRYRAKPAEAEIIPLENDTIYVKLFEPQKAITPGQTVAMYRGETVIGGAIIERQGR